MFLTCVGAFVPTLHVNNYPQTVIVSESMYYVCIFILYPPVEHIFQTADLLCYKTISTWYLCAQIARGPRSAASTASQAAHQQPVCL